MRRLVQPDEPICAEGSTIKRALIEQLRAPVMDEFRAVTDAVPGVRVWGPAAGAVPGRCVLGLCGGAALYFDADHLSGYANRLLAPDLLEFSVGRVAREKARGFAPGTPLGP
ncbi:MAG: SGNH hydrolase domain-containing protein [Rhodospirillales bacterium]